MSSCFGPRVSTSPTPRPTFGTPVPKVPTRWPIDRVVYLMLENRSFDNIFGRYPGPRVAPALAFERGRRSRSIHCPEWLPGDLAHDTASWYAMYNDGKMDGFAIGEFGPYYAYSQFDRADVPNYFRWADRYVLCDNFFASVAGPSHPNHLFLIAGQAGGAIDNPENIRGQAPQRRPSDEELGVRRLWRRRVRQRPR